MKFILIIILVLISATTSAKISNLSNKESKKAPSDTNTCFITKSTDWWASSMSNTGPFTIKYAQTGADRGLIFENLTNYSEEYLKKAFTQEQFNNFFVKSGLNFMIPFRYIVNCSSPVRGMFNYQNIKLTLKADNEISKIIGLRLQYNAILANPWSADDRINWCKTIVPLGQVKRNAASQKKGILDNDLSEYDIEKGQLILANELKVNKENKLQKLQDEQTTADTNVETKTSAANAAQIAFEELMKTEQAKLEKAKSEQATAELISNNLHTSIEGMNNAKLQAILEKPDLIKTKLNTQFGLFNTHIENTRTELTGGANLKVLLDSAKNTMKVKNDDESKLNSSASTKINNNISNIRS
jgi:hypothetical protein